MFSKLTFHFWFSHTAIWTVFLGTTTRRQQGRRASITDTRGGDTTPLTISRNLKMLTRKLPKKISCKLLKIVNLVEYLLEKCLKTNTLMISRILEWRDSWKYNFFVENICWMVDMVVRPLYWCCEFPIIVNDEYAKHVCLK